MTAIENITAPPTLADKPGWLCWRLEQMAGEKKPRKIPYYANGKKRYGKQGDERDRAQLVTFEDAKKAAILLKASGVGLALLPDFGITALDFDHCVKDGVVNKDVEGMLIGTYAELSPSGTARWSRLTTATDTARCTRTRARRTWPSARKSPRVILSPRWAARDDLRARTSILKCGVTASRSIHRSSCRPEALGASSSPRYCASSTMIRQRRWPHA